MRRIFRWISQLAVLLLLACVGLAAYFLWYPLFEKGREVRAILSKAKTVSLVEYRSVNEEREYADELTRQLMSPAQIEAVSSAFSGLGWFDGAKACEFEPHHALLCSMEDGSIQVIHICFRCSDVAIDGGAPFDFHSWKPAVQRAIESCGVPVRPELYRFTR